MPVYHRSRLIHIHIPKTGGTAIERFFHSIGDMVWGKESWLGQEYLHERWYEFQHLSMSELLSFTSEYRAFHSFAVIRNPYSRLVSEFHWRHPILQQRDAPLLSFDSFADLVWAIPSQIGTQWRECLAGADRRRSNFLIHVRPQHHYVCLPNGNQVVMELLRFERLQEDFNELLGRYGMRTDLITKPRERNLADYYDRELLDRVNSIYSRDFALGGYEML